jgi:hypothetical protein
LHKVLAVATLLAVAACTMADRDPTDPVSPAAYDGSSIAVITGTPFYALAKSAVCVAGALIGRAGSAAMALTDRPDRDRQRTALHESIGRNCRGSYYLPPQY